MYHTEKIGCFWKSKLSLKAENQHPCQTDKYSYHYCFNNSYYVPVNVMPEGVGWETPGILTQIGVIILHLLLGTHPFFKIQNRMSEFPSVNKAIPEIPGVEKCLSSDSQGLPPPPTSH